MSLYYAKINRSASSWTQSQEYRWQQRARRAGANQHAGKALSEIPALKPYRGKPAVRNFRGGNGNVGIIRSPVRAIALPDNAVIVRNLPCKSLRGMKSENATCRELTGPCGALVSYTALREAEVYADGHAVAHLTPALTTLRIVAVVCETKVLPRA